MNILEAKPTYQAQDKWTARMEERYNAALLKEKQKLFSELEIPFPSEIEAKFSEYVSKGNKHPEVYLENLCHSYIKYALDHYAEILYQKLISNYDGDTIYESEMHKILGKYGTHELIKSGLIESCGSYKGNRLFAI